MSDPASRKKRPANQAVAAYRDALLRAAPADELARLAALLDPEVVAWLDLFQTSRREAIRPDPAFVRRLDQIIAAAPGPQPAQSMVGTLTPLRLIRSHTANGRRTQMTTQTAIPARPLAPWHVAWPQSAARMAAAVLLLALLVGSAWTALYPLRLWDNEGLPLFATLGTPTAESQPTDERVLLNLTLSDFPPYLSEGGMFVMRYPAGGSSREHTTETTEVLYVAIGPMQATVEEALEPVRVIPPHEPGTQPLAAELGAGEQATLETGTTLVAPPGTVIDLVNEGSAPTAVLDLLWASTTLSTEDGGATRERAIGWMSQDLVLPVSFLLRQVTLDAGEALPPSASRDAGQSVAAVDAERVADVTGGANGAATNEGDEPLEAYVLTVFNDAAASPLITPEQDSPAPEATPSPGALVDFTLTDIEPFTAEGGMAITDYPAGGSSRELAGRGSPEIFYVAAGPMTMNVEEAPQPIRVISQQGTASPTSEQALDQGAEITLETGTLVYLPEKAIVNLLNPGPEPTTMIDLLWATESYSTEAGNALWFRVSSPHTQDIVSPTRITLRQATIAANEPIAGPSTDTVAIAAAAVDKARRAILPSTRDDGYHNNTGESLAVYVLTVESGSESSTPAAAIETPTAGMLEFLWDANGDPDPMVNPYGFGVDPQGNV